MISQNNKDEDALSRDKALAQAREQNCFSVYICAQLIFFLTTVILMLVLVSAYVVVEVRFLILKYDAFLILAVFVNPLTYLTFSFFSLV